jgi:hypothetical protein
LDVPEELLSGPGRLKGTGIGTDTILLTGFLSPHSLHS